MEYPRNVQITKGTVNGPFFCSRLSYLKLGFVPTKKQRVRAKSDAIVYQAKSKQYKPQLQKIRLPQYRDVLASNAIVSKEQRAVCDRKAKSNEIDLHGKTLTKI